MQNREQDAEDLGYFRAQVDARHKGLEDDIKEIKSMLTRQNGLGNYARMGGTGAVGAIALVMALSKLL